MFQIERIYPSGEREIIYKSGTRKIIRADGKSRKFFFYNGDIKEIFFDGQEVSLITLLKFIHLFLVSF